MSGRPFRFLALVSVGWIGARVALLWPQTGSLPEAVKALVPMPTVAEAVPVPIVPVEAPVRAHLERAGAAPSWRPPLFLSRMPSEPLIIPAMAAPDALRVQLAPIDLMQYGRAQSVDGPFALPALASPKGLYPPPDRWSASGWVVARPGSGAAAAPGGQLGGGQAGLRVAFLLDRNTRIAAFARFTTPLSGKGREAAIGLEWQPTRAPVRLVAERRFGLDGTPGGSGLGVVGGVDTSVRGFRLEGYGQAGAVSRARIEPYADGAVRVTRTIVPRVSLGAGVWGGAQRDAQRLDTGPSAMVSFKSVRLSLDWRQRIAGRARPGSGVALTLGGDF